MFQFIFAVNVRLIKFRIKPKEDGNGKQNFRNFFEHANRLGGGGSVLDAKLRDQNSAGFEGQKCQLIENYACNNILDKSVNTNDDGVA